MAASQDHQNLLQPHDGIQAFFSPSSYKYDLQRYVETGRRLPDTEENYKNHLNILITNDEWDKRIKSIVRVYVDIRKHCSYFREKYVETVKLASAIISEAIEVENIYPVLSQSLQTVAEGKDKDDINDSIEFANTVLADRQEFFKEQIHRAEEVEKLYRQFEQETTDDQARINNVSKGLQSVGSVREDSHSGLREAVNALRLLCDDYKDDKDTDFFPILGCIPRGIFDVQSPDVVRVLKLVRQIIGGKNKSEAIKLEIMQLQGEVMQRDLADIRKLIEPALLEIRLLQGHYTILNHDLDILKVDLDKAVNQSHPKMKYLNIAVITKKWANLSATAALYRENAFVTIPN